MLLFLAVVFVGILFILRGLNLGIMFVSPSDKMLDAEGKMIQMKYKQKTQKIEKILQKEEKEETTD